MKKKGKGNPGMTRKVFVMPELTKNEDWNLKANTSGVFWNSNGGNGGGAGLPGNPTFWGGGNGGS